MQLREPLSLPNDPSDRTSAAQYQNHRILTLQLGQLSVLPSVVGKLIVGEYRSKE